MRKIICTLLCALSVPAMAVNDGDPSSSKGLESVVSIGYFKAIGRADGEPYLMFNTECTGTLIDKDKVLTSVECAERRPYAFDEIPGKYIFSATKNRSGERISQRIKTFDINTFVSDSEALGITVRKVTGSAINPDYDPSRLVIGSGNPGNLAILTLQSPVEGVSPMPLATAEQLDMYVNNLSFPALKFAGFGLKREGFRPGKLQTTDLIVYHGVLCDLRGEDINTVDMRVQYSSVGDTQLCTDNSPPSAILCDGDLGGPLLIQTSVGKFALAGVAGTRLYADFSANERGGRSSYNCSTDSFRPDPHGSGDGGIGLFEKPLSYSDWVEANTSLTF